MFKTKIKQIALVFGIMLTGVFMIPQNTDARCELDCGKRVFVCPDGYDCSVINGVLSCDGKTATCR